MSTLMEYKALSNSKLIPLTDKLFIENLSVEDLINHLLDNQNEDINTSLRHELVCRGKDDIKCRITIKKTFKVFISEMEIALREPDNDSNLKKTTIELQTQKIRFLNTVSLLDRLQLEWQKYDLILKR